MKKLFFSLLLCQMAFIAYGQNPVIVSQAQAFQKWISVRDSLILTNLPTGVSIGNIGYTATGKLVRPSQPPIATLTGGTVYELTTSNPSTTLNWSYSKNTLTANIVSAVINPGSFNKFSSSTSASGTQNVTTTANTNTTYNFLVTSADGSTTNPTTIVTFLPRFYYGRSASATPNSTIVLAFAGGSNPLSASKAQTFTVTASGSNYVYLSYPSSQGALSSIKVGGFESIGAFTQTTISITNASGYTQNYYVYTSNNTFSATTPSIVTL